MNCRFGVVNGVAVAAIVVGCKGAVLGRFRTPGQLILRCSAVAQRVVDPNVASQRCGAVFFYKLNVGQWHRHVIGAVDGDHQIGRDNFTIFVGEGVAEGFS